MENIQKSNSNNTLIENSKNNSQNFNFDIFYLESLINRFVLNSDINSSSKQTYKRGMSSFLKWCKINFHKNNFNITRETILLYKDSLLNSNLKPFTKSLYLVCIRQFFTWTESLLIYPNIAKGIKGIRRLTKSHHKDSLTRDQVLTLLKSINISNLSGMRDFLLIYLLVHTGLRLIEVSNILIQDLEIKGENESSIVWIKGKGRDGKDAFVVLVKEVKDLIIKYIKMRMDDIKKNSIKISEDSYLFTSHGPRTNKNNFFSKLSTHSISRIIKNRLKSAGIKNKRISAHSLRHTFGVMAIQGGASLYEVQLAMRHSSPTTTQVYLGDIEQIKRKEAAPENKVRDLLNLQF